MRELGVLRWLFLLIVSLTTLTAASSLWSVLRVDSLTPMEALLLVLFAVLFAWISASFWIACLGAYALSRGLAQSGLSAAPKDGCAPSRTAIIMPVYNEDPRRVFAGIRAIHESVALAGAAAQFDFYILSDSTEAACWLAEELEWQRLCGLAGGDARIFYRHRPRNTRRKSGNIADFCENWGSLYDYMVVLDADSLMTGDTLVRLAGMMDAHPRTALIQAPPLLVGRGSVFARMQQFASSLYGPVYAAGLALLQGPDGNYWGHNAIIRVRPFMQHCGLPLLPGAGPLGGEILSHDFVEAALLRRAGWELRLAPELSGSYEEPPPTPIDHLKRDRRWCHGNMQHLRLILARGLRMPSRIHLAFGVMTYLSAPLWALMIAVSAMVMKRSEHFVPVAFIGRHPVLFFPVRHTLELETLVLATAVLLYAPKFLAFLILRRDRENLEAHGGPGRAAASLVLECFYSTLMAPVVMFSHMCFVLGVVFGRRASWGSQRRDDRGVSLRACTRMFLPHSLAGIAVGLAVWTYIPGSLAWFVPLVLGFALAIPFGAVAGAPGPGAWVRRRGLFLTPAETMGLPILERMKHFLDEETGRRAETGVALLQLVKSDPAVAQLHRALLADVAPATPAAAAPEGRVVDEWYGLLSDAAGLAALDTAAEAAGG